MKPPSQSYSPIHGADPAPALRVLVVDDEQINRELLARMLRRAGYQASAVESAGRALEELAASTFDLVLLDVVMPGRDGFDCLSGIRKLFSVTELPVIMVTGEVERERIIEAFRLGANDYVTKPIDREIMLARIAGHARLRTTLAALRESEERYALVARGTNDGLWDWDVAAGRVYYSPRWESMLGIPAGAAADRPATWVERLHPDDRERFVSLMQADSPIREDNFRLELRMLHADGGYRWMICRGAMVRGESGRVMRIAGSLTDVTEGKVGDALTGLPNRLLFTDRLERAIDRFRRNPQQQFAVMFLDLDNFKLVNDSLGHEAGDRLLITISERLTQSLRSTDTVCRIGCSATLARHAGDEFTILLEDFRNPDDVGLVATRLLEEIGRPVELNGQEFVPSATIGWTLASGATPRAEDLIREADTAMYQAKAAGRNCWRRFEPTMRDQATRRLELENELRQGLRNGEFFLLFQPIVRVGDQRPVGFESLVRWQHPRRGVVGPPEFIPLAEELGLIVPLGWQIIEMACDAAVTWIRELPDEDFLVSVNVSVRQLAEGDFAARLIETAERFGLPPHHLCIELTESGLMERPQAVRSLLQQLQESGFRIAVDDFGTGYSSLSYLHRLPVDILKIDRTFPGSMLESRENFQIVRSVIDLARNLELTVIAEGVETLEQRRVLNELGCEFAQGYLWSRPIDREQAGALRRSGHSLGPVNGVLRLPDSAVLNPAVVDVRSPGPPLTTH